MPQPSLPHHRLLAWHLAAELVRLVNDIRISDADDRREARRAAKSCARNVAEGAGRTSRADKASASPASSWRARRGPAQPVTSLG